MLPPSQKLWRTRGCPGLRDSAPLGLRWEIAARWAKDDLEWAGVGFEGAYTKGTAKVGGGVSDSGEGERAAGGFGGVAGERAGPGDVAVAVRVEQVAVLRAYLKIERGPSARLLALAGVGSAIWLPKPLPISCRELTCASRRQSARCGDAQASPPWPPPKPTAAGPL